MKNTLNLARMAVLIALGVAASYLLPIPVYGAKLFPAQHAINVIAGVLLGPWLAGITALGIAVARILLGTGTPLAIPGSVIGAVLAGLLYRPTRSYLAAMAGEVMGTGLLGALVAFPIATLLLGNTKAAAAGATFFILPFTFSSAAGAVLAGLALPVIMRVARPAGRQSESR